jgi:hypothetical protein
MSPLQVFSHPKHEDDVCQIPLEIHDNAAGFSIMLNKACKRELEFVNHSLAWCESLINASQARGATQCGGDKGTIRCAFC